MAERIERLLGKIPGYDAYNSKESMRDDDRRLREQIADRLNGAMTDLTRISSELADRRQLAAIGAVEDLVRDTRLLGDRVQTASYGYEGLFSDRKVDEFALGQLKRFDLAFDAHVDRLVSTVAAIGTEGETPETRLHDARTQVDNLDRLFNARNDVITTASTVSDPNVLALLEMPVTLSPKEQQLLRVGSGGAVAILGDNFQIGSHIAVKHREDTALLLLRLDTGPEWLAVERNDGVRCWRVQETPVNAPLVGGNTGSVTVSGPKGTQTDVPAKYDVQRSASGDSPSATIQLAVGGEDRAWAGSHVPLIDIEIYSEGNTA